MEDKIRKAHALIHHIFEDGLEKENHIYEYLVKADEFLEKAHNAALEQGRK